MRKIWFGLAALAMTAALGACAMFERENDALCPGGQNCPDAFAE